MILKGLIHKLEVDVSEHVKHTDEEVAHPRAVESSLVARLDKVANRENVESFYLSEEHNPLAVRLVRVSEIADIHDRLSFEHRVDHRQLLGHMFNGQLRQRI